MAHDLEMMSRSQRREARNAIRDYAQSRGCLYRITSDGEVHFHGRMPNSDESGWYLFTRAVREAVKHALNAV